MIRAIVIVIAGFLVALINGSVIPWIPGIRAAPLLSGGAIVGMVWGSRPWVAIGWTVLVAFLADLLRAHAVGVRSLAFIGASILIAPVIRRYTIERDIGSAVMIATVLASTERAFAILLTDGIEISPFAFGAFAARWVFAVVWAVLLVIGLRRVARDVSSPERFTPTHAVVP